MKNKMKIDKMIHGLVSIALGEDGVRNDITTRLLVPAAPVSRGYIAFKQDGVLCGIKIARSVFKKLDPHVRFKVLNQDGEWIKKGTRIALIEGKTRALLAGERTALNFLMHLSGIATTTRRFVNAVRPCQVQILDTRKTTPGLRVLERYAVRTGGGKNHRFNLSDMVLIKDNHRRVIKDRYSLAQAVNKLKKTRKAIEVEVNTLSEFKSVLPAVPEYILLDNMSVKDIRKAVTYLKSSKLKKKPLLEVSGGININNIHDVARTGVDRISIGALTHSRTAIDISMELI